MQELLNITIFITVNVVALICLELRKVSSETTNFAVDPVLSRTWIQPLLLLASSPRSHPYHYSVLKNKRASTKILKRIAENFPYELFAYGNQPIDPVDFLTALFEHRNSTREIRLTALSLATEVFSETSPIYNHPTITEDLTEWATEMSGQDASIMPHIWKIKLIRAATHPVEQTKTVDTVR